MSQKKIYSLGLGMVLVASSGWALDEPDLQKENRMHQIYQNYHSNPTDTNQWQKAKENSKSKNYNIQKGDTLWGLSETLFGDPYFWPKLWSVNSDLIENPHEINAKKQIQFEGGSMDTPPQLSLSNSEPATEVTAEEKTESVEVSKNEKSKVEIPQKDSFSKAVSGLPKSLPYWQFRKPASSAEFQPVKVRTRFPEADKKIPFFLSDSEIANDGVVKETEMGMNSAADYQYIHVRINKNVTSPQKFYLVLQKKSVINKFGSKGRVVEVQGKIEILDRINEDQNMYRAIVRESLSQVEVNSILVPQDWLTYNKSFDGTVSATAVRVIGGQTQENSILFGNDHILYLKGGQSDGVNIGQVIEMFMDLKQRTANKTTRENYRRIGLIKIIHTDEHVSTGVVVDSKEAIVPGDFSITSEVR